MVPNSVNAAAMMTMPPKSTVPRYAFGQALRGRPAARVEYRESTPHHMFHIRHSCPMRPKSGLSPQTGAQPPDPSSRARIPPSGKDSASTEKTT